ncbi:hypothetical protein D3C76_1441500 [compost metagenome]
MLHLCVTFRQLRFEPGPFGFFAPGHDQQFVVSLLELADLLVARRHLRLGLTLQGVLLARQLLRRTFVFGQLGRQLLDLRLSRLGFGLRCNLCSTGLGLLALQGLQLLGGAAQLRAQAFLHAFGARPLGHQRAQGKQQDFRVHEALPAP